MNSSNKIHLYAAILACCVTAGCFTYKPAPNPAMTKQEAIKAIDDLVNQARNNRMYRAGLADERGCSYPLPMEGQMLCRLEYKDIEDVEVNVNFATLGLLGIADPTGYSAVRITFKDATVVELRRLLFGTIFNFAPFYLVSPGCLKVHNAAIGLTMMKESVK